jgi:protocatechuate 3,4-dioxygenase beta subunit
MGISSLNRRQALGLLSGATLALIGNRWSSAATTAANSSALTPELTEGPYYIDLERIRRDITEGKSGVPLRLRIRVLQLGTSAPVPNAAVDIWHCDAQGVYSGFDSHLPPPPGKGNRPPPPMPPPDGLAWTPGQPPPPGGPPGFGGNHKPDNKKTFLRGVQLTNSEGLAEIDTIFPGWYQGRTTHIHVRIHDGGTVANGRYQHGHISHTGQIFLPEDITNRVYQLPAYAKNQQGRILLEEDGIYRSQQGQPLARLTPIDPQHADSGFFSDSVLTIDPAVTPTRV